jgi:hypothetical protein
MLVPSFDFTFPAVLLFAVVAGALLAVGGFAMIVLLCLLLM